MKINTKTTGERISSLRKEKGLKQIDLAKELNVSRQIISYYETGTRMPNVEDIVILSEILNTSTDYLLGLSDAETNDKDIQFICDYTGLNESSVRTLNRFKDVCDFNFLNSMILNLSFTSEIDDYRDYLEIERKYVNGSMETFNQYFSNKYNLSEDMARDAKKQLHRCLECIDAIDLKYFRLIERFKDRLNEFTSGKQKELDEKRTEIQKAILDFEVRANADNNKA